MWPSQQTAFDSDSIQKLWEQIIKIYFKTLSTAPRKSDGSKKPTFFYKNLYTKVLVHNPASMMSITCLQDRRATAILIMCLAEWFFEKLRDYSRSRLNAAMKKAETHNDPIDLSGEVNRFVGWAILELMKAWKEQESHDEESGEVLELLQSMSYTHQEAITNDDYMENRYEAYDILLNLGNMTLVSCGPGGPGGRRSARPASRGGRRSAGPASRRIGPAPRGGRPEWSGRRPSLRGSSERRRRTNCWRRPTTGAGWTDKGRSTTGRRRS